MTIPVDEERDSDIIIMRGLNAFTLHAQAVAEAMDAAGCSECGPGVHHPECSRRDAPYGDKVAQAVREEREASMALLYDVLNGYDLLNSYMPTTCHQGHGYGPCRTDHSHRARAYLMEMKNKIASHLRARGPQ